MLPKTRDEWLEWQEYKRKRRLRGRENWDLTCDSNEPPDGVKYFMAEYMANEDDPADIEPVGGLPSQLLGCNYDPTD